MSDPFLPFCFESYIVVNAGIFNLRQPCGKFSYRWGDSPRLVREGMPPTGAVKAAVHWFHHLDVLHFYLCHLPFSS